jgi:uncharacterized DUF497 family protein
VTDLATLTATLTGFDWDGGNAERLLAVVFTVRGDRICVISARPMSRKERGHYAKIPHEGP